MPDEHVIPPESWGYEPIDKISCSMNGSDFNASLVDFDLNVGALLDKYVVIEEWMGTW